jgi:hypothetical protein
MKVQFECDVKLINALYDLYKIWGKGQNRYPDDSSYTYMLDNIRLNIEVIGKPCCICNKIMESSECFSEGKPAHWVCRDGPPKPLKCVRSNCGKDATHEVKSDGGFFGMGYCDEHWKERDLEAESKILME